MKNQNTVIEELIKGLPPIEEGLFKYFDIARAYEVTINFIKGDSSIPSHTHDQTVFNYVVEGEFEVEDKSGKTLYRKGDWIRIEKGDPHAVIAKRQTILLEFWEK